MIADEGFTQCGLFVDLCPLSGLEERFRDQFKIVTRDIVTIMLFGLTLANCASNQMNLCEILRKFRCMLDLRGSTTQLIADYGSLGSPGIDIPVSNTPAFR
jgi:hypothetical protein